MTVAPLRARELKFPQARAERGAPDVAPLRARELKSRALPRGLVRAPVAPLRARELKLVLNFSVHPPRMPSRPYGRVS